MSLFHNCIRIYSYAFRHELSRISSDKERGNGEECTLAVWGDAFGGEGVLSTSSRHQLLPGLCAGVKVMVENNPAWPQYVFSPCQSPPDLYSISLLAPLSANVDVTQSQFWGLSRRIK